MPENRSLVSEQQIANAVLTVRGERVLLDVDLAALYGVSTKTLNQAVRRNLSRFPPDFMFQLTNEEFENWRSQIVISNDAASNRSRIVTGSQKHRDPRYAPYAFTEQGVAMLSSVLRSARAVQVNIEIMRTFVRLRRVLAVSSDLAKHLDEVEKRLGSHDEQFVQVIRAIRQLMEPPPSKRRRIGFHVPQSASPNAKPSSDGKAKSPRTTKLRKRTSRGR
jgi:hypothetical protein